MQYILSEEEYKAMKDAALETAFKEKAKLQRFCTMMADTMPIKFWGREEATPWGCTLTKEDKGEEWYCDECPAQEICPLEDKRWSK